MAEPAVAPAPAPVAAPAPAPSASPTGAPPAVSVATPAPAPAANEAKGYWPENWQARLAGDDEKALKQVARYASPEDIWKKARSLEQRLSSGEFKAALPKDPKPEEVAAWRKDNGIPEAPDKYDLKGITIPKGDEEVIGNFLKRMHGANYTPEQARVAVESYYSEQQRQVQARQTRDDDERHSALDTLNQEYGGSFRRNINLVEGTILSQFPEDVRDLIRSARLPNGQALFNNVSAVKALVALALQINPAGVVAPAGSGDLAKPALAEYQELQKFMREKRTAYNKDPAKQARVTELIEYLRKQDLIDDNGNVVVQAKKAA